LDLILHIGLGKTGTTTLQQRHFVHLPGYLGRPELFGQRGRGARLHVLARSARQGAAVDLDAWRSTILQRLTDAGAGDVDRVVISQERLAGWSQDGSALSPITGRLSDAGRAARRGQHPFAAFVREHVVPAWAELGDVRVLITLRNQHDWLCSHYAQLSNRIIGASQSDFERQVRWILASDDAYLDFASLVDAFGSAVGQERVSVLLLEDIASPAYWETLSSLVGTQLPKEGAVQQRANQRSTAEGWELRAYNRRKYPLRVTLFGQEPTPDHPSMWTLRAVTHPLHAARVLVRRRGSAIRPNEELRAAIRAHFRRSNARLGEHLGRDLAPLGY
jgi:hypothetical protein